MFRHMNKLLQIEKSYHLHKDQRYDNAGVVDQVEKKPQLDRLDVGCLWEGVGLPHVDGGEHHHDGDVDGQPQIIFILPPDVDRRLVDHVHQKRRDVGHSQHTEISQYCITNRNLD